MKTHIWRTFAVAPAFVANIPGEVFAEPAESGDWAFEDVTTDVVDRNPPGIGPMFDDAFLDIVNAGNYGTRRWKNNGDGTFLEFDKGTIPWAVNAHLRLDDFEMLFPATKKITRFASIKANRYVVLRPDGGMEDVVFGRK